MPDLAPGELLWSGIARYSQAIGDKSGRATARRTFRRGYPAADIPSPLDAFRAVLPKRYPMTARDLLIGHTTFSYTVRFASAPGTEKLERWALHGGQRPGKLGTFANRLGVSAFLRACPDCAFEQTRDLGDPRWLVCHQLPGVMLCAVHGSPLVQTLVHAGAARSAETLVPLGTIQLCDLPRLKLPCQAGIALRYARRSKILAELPINGGGAGSRIPGRILRYLEGYAWSRAPSCLDADRLAVDVARHQGFRDILGLAGAVIPTHRNLCTTLHRILREPAQSKHPVAVLALMEFTGITMDDLMTEEAVSPDVPAQLGSAVSEQQQVMPCVNPTCGLFVAHPVAQASDFNNEPTSHSCRACGFSYRWRPGARYPFALLSTGPTWDAELHRLLAEGTHSSREMSRRLGVSASAVLARLKHGPTPARLRDEKLRDRHRLAWQSFRKSGGRGPAKSLPSAIRNAYRFLLRNDRDWLTEHQPLIRKMQPTSLDWAERDANWAKVLRRSLTGDPTADTGRSVAGLVRGRLPYYTVMKDRSRLKAVWRVLEFQLRGKGSVTGPPAASDDRDPPADET